MRGELEREWIHVYVWLSPFPVHLKLSQHCLLTGYFVVVVFQLLSCVWQFATPMNCSMPGLLKLISIELMMPSNHLIFCCPLLLLPSIFPIISVFSNESALHIRWPKYWSFSFNISPSNEHSGLISFRMDWLDLLAVKGTQESSPIPQFKSINSSALSFL